MLNKLCGTECKLKDSSSNILPTVKFVACQVLQWYMTCHDIVSQRAKYDLFRVFGIGEKIQFLSSIISSAATPARMRLQR